MHDFGDALVNELPPNGDVRHFDRFYFNLHDASTDLLVMVGAGVYPGKKVVDGFVVLVDTRRQRNVRFSTVAEEPLVEGVGPLRWTTIEPQKSWRMTLAENPLGATFDVTWRSRTSAWHNTVTIENTRSAPSVFDHLVQSGRYEGTLSVDGTTRSVDGWWGQRDRSRGVRNVSGGQGLHLWVQAQFPDRCVSFLLGENRRNDGILLEGSVLGESGQWIRSSMFGMPWTSTTGSICAVDWFRYVPRADGSTRWSVTPLPAVAFWTVRDTAVSTDGSAAETGSRPTRSCSTGRWRREIWAPR
jgi:hypothetical protein